MGVYAQYLDQGFGGDPNRVQAERKKQLQRISDARGHDVMAYAAAVTKGRLPVAIAYDDILPFNDQLSNLKNSGRTGVDLILETGGGSGETVEDLVRLLRERYKFVGVIVPGMAKSAGTLLAMAADEILMEGVSALGPIDAQIFWQGKQFSAHALLEGMRKIKDEVTLTKTLNRAYVPILQTLSPGELQHAQNSLDFACDLVTEWLVNYKFKDWTTHTSTGQPVTPESRRERATQIAKQLHDHGRWKTHGRSIKIHDLRQMRLKVTDYSETPELADAIRRYHTLSQMTLQTNVYKLIETPKSQIMRTESIQTSQVMLPFQSAGATAAAIGFGVQCKKCGTMITGEARFDSKVKPTPGVVQFPANNVLKCPGKGCTEMHDLTPLRQQLESQVKRKII